MRMSITGTFAAALPPNISSNSRKFLGERPKGVARAYVLVYIEACWDN
jgi:hypothetical protein